MADIEDSLAVQPVRRRLPDERQAIVHHFNVGEYEGYLTVGLYEDGRPGEIFITTAKEGSTVSGLMDCFATAVSLALQYGVALKVLCDKFSHTRFRAERMVGSERDRVRQLVDGLLVPLVSTQVPPACVSCPNGRRGSRCGFGARPPVEKRIGRRANRRASLQRVRVFTGQCFLIFLLRRSDSVATRWRSADAPGVGGRAWLCRL